MPETLSQLTLGRTADSFLPGEGGTFEKYEEIMMSREEEMKRSLEKAQVLIEALPYIQRFNRKIIVVKYGGSAMVDEELKRNVIKDVTLLKLVGFKPIIVHGGGKEISRWVGKAGMEPRFINGLRVTDADTMEIAEMVLGKVGKSLVQIRLRRFWGWRKGC